MTIDPRTAHIDSAPGDVAEWLLGELREIPHAIGRAIDVSGGTPEARQTGHHLSRAAKAALGQQFLTTLRAALRADVADLLLQGWRKHRTLITAATETLAEPGTERLITLAEHHVHWVHEPTLDVILDGVRLLTLSAHLDVMFEIGEVVAVVRAGRLCALRVGTATMTGSVAVADQEISRRTVKLQLPVVMKLGTGLNLTTTHPRVPGRQPVDQFP